NLPHLKRKRVQVVELVQDVGEEADRVQHGAAVDAGHLGRHLGQAPRPHALEQRLRRRDQPRQQAQRRGRQRLGVHGDRGLADDGEQGDDVEAPAAEVELAGREPALGGRWGVGGGHGGWLGGGASG
ncbi:hypothetical protein QBC39DRAFT_242839, partial [Podospora conica]